VFQSSIGDDVSGIIELCEDRLVIQFYVIDRRNFFQARYPKFRIEIGTFPFVVGEHIVSLFAAESKAAVGGEWHKSIVR